VNPNTGGRDFEWAQLSNQSVSRVRTVSCVGGCSQTMHRLQIRTSAVLNQLNNSMSSSVVNINEKTPAPSPSLGAVPAPVIPAAAPLPSVSSAAVVAVASNPTAGKSKSAPSGGGGGGGGDSGSDHLVVRRLAVTDYDKGYLQLLSQLTDVGNITRQQFEERFRQREALGYITFVIEDTSKGLIIATATLLLEYKFIHGCGTIGHTEDVVVNSTYRGKNLGVRVMEALKTEGRERGCYKIILDCSVANTTFYAKLGFVEKERQMAIYFTNPDTADAPAAAKPATTAAS